MGGGDAGEVGGRIPPPSSRRGPQFFTTLSDSAETVQRQAEPPSWAVGGDSRSPGLIGWRPSTASGRRFRRSWRGRIVESAPAARPDEVRARTLDSLRAIMMIRAYRMRGHLKAKLDPLGLAITEGDATELDPATYGFAERDFDRPIFLDYVLGLETATVREILDLLKRTYCGTVGVQYMHITDPL